MKSNSDVRAHVSTLLDWGHAHVTFDAAVKGIPARARGAVPARWEYSLWQLVEHIRIAQADILEFCVSPKYKEKKWPDDYWPASRAPRSSAAWTRSLADIRRDRAKLQRLAANGKIDPLATIPHGSGQTYLRELLLIADHTAYHVGQIVALRRQLGNWPQKR
jgi:uncharacterized damage-inducible protein DinB